MEEFDLIARVRARVQEGPGEPSVVLGIGDDAAVLAPEPGHDLVATTDTLVAGRHFPPGLEAEAVGHLALAVNLSDIAAMGASPRWLLLSLTLPEGDEAWLDGFLEGFLGLAGKHGCVLVGGNMASGPMSITVQVLGQVATGRAVTRGGARAGDRIAVTGVVGEAAAGLALEPDAPAELAQRLFRPEPRLAAGTALAAHARAMVDISDGLLADLGHLLDPAGLGGVLELQCLPVSDALATAIPEPERRWRLQLSGGGDYELLVVLPPDAFPAAEAACRQAGCDLTEIGRVRPEPGIECRRPDGRPFVVEDRGWDHFAGMGE